MKIKNFLANKAQVISFTAAAVMMITLLFPVIFDTHRTDHSADQYKGTVTILEATEQIQHFVPEAPQARSVDYYFQIPSLSRDTDISF